MRRCGVEARAARAQADAARLSADVERREGNIEALELAVGALEACDERERNTPRRAELLAKAEKAWGPDHASRAPTAVYDVLGPLPT